MAAPFVDAGVTHVVAIESRGFILGGPVADQLSAPGSSPFESPGKLPAKRVARGTRSSTAPTRSRSMPMRSQVLRAC